MEDSERPPVRPLSWRRVGWDGLWSQTSNRNGPEAAPMSEFAPLIEDARLHCWGCDPEFVFHGRASGVATNGSSQPVTASGPLSRAGSHADFDGSRHHHLAFVLVPAWRLVLPRLLSGRQWVREDAAFERRRTQAGCSRRGGGLGVSVGGTRRKGGRGGGGRGGGGAATGAHSRARPLAPLGSVGSSAPELADQLVLDETEDVLDPAAFLRLGGQQPLKHSQGVVGEAPPLRRVRPHGTTGLLPATELLVEGVHRQSGLPGEIPRQHTEDQHAERPHVEAGGHQEALGSAGAAHLRCGVRDGPAHAFHAAAHASGHAKVSQFDASALTIEQEHVLGFDVAMHQVLAVDKVQSQAQLLHAAFHHFLRQTHLRRRNKGWETEDEPSFTIQHMGGGSRAPKRGEEENEAKVSRL